MKKLGSLVMKTILVTLVAIITLIAISIGVGLLIGETASKDCVEVSDGRYICN